MADIATMQFRSVSTPEQYGIMALSDDGTFRVVPSDEFRDEMARLEEVALERSQTFGIRAGIGLILLGTAAISVGWLFGRLFGKLGTRLSEPRPVQDVTISRDDRGRVRVTVRGLESRLQTVQMVWNADEFLLPEADVFVSKLEEMKHPNSSVRDIIL